MDRFSFVLPRTPSSSPGHTPPASPRRSLSQSSVTLGESLSDQARHTTPTTAPSVVASAPPPPLSPEEQLRAAIDREDIEAVKKCFKEHPDLKEAFCSVSEKNVSKEYKIAGGKTKYADPVYELSYATKYWTGDQPVRAVKKIINSFSTTFFDRGRYGGCTLLTYAILKGKSVGFIEKLLKEAACHRLIIQPDGAGRLPLCLAVESGNEELIDLLLPYCNLEAKNGQGLTPAMVAARSGKYDLAKRLLGESPSPEHVHALACVVVLNVPAHGEDGEAFSFFVNLFKTGKLDPQKTDDKGRTLLHLVAQEGMSNPQLLGFLFKRGIPLHATDHSGKTVLHHALEKGHFEIAEFILKRDPKRVKDEYNSQTCLHLAAEAGNLKCFKLIFQQPEGKELLQTRDRLSGKTPLHLALVRGHYEIAEFILQEVPEELKSTHEHGYNCFHYAISSRNMGCFNLILSQSGAIELLQKRTVTVSSVTPLMQAIIYGPSEMAQLILEKYPELIKVRDQYGNTCLHLAVLHNIECLKLILSQPEGKEFLKEKNQAGLTPLELALEEMEEKAVNLINNFIK